MIAMAAAQLTDCRNKMLGKFEMTVGELKAKLADLTDDLPLHIQSMMTLWGRDHAVFKVWVEDKDQLTMLIDYDSRKL